jgi:predicted CoA-binding protein
MANKVTFQIKIEGENELRTVTVDAKELGEAFSAVQIEVEHLKGGIVTLASTFQLLEGADDAISQIKDTMSEWASIYQEDAVAETRLATAMRNTMNASDEEIESIKALAEAQERLGVVSAGVQLSAAQELATYLEYSDSLKTILPVLNDMVAQQLGIGASAESATQIATMLGKVMNGQTEALSRYGYKFDEAQKYILQYGDECERAAVLAEVVEQSVAGMNEALAQTPSGAIAQAEIRIEGIKASLGKATEVAMPFISALSELSLAALGVTKLAMSFKALMSSTAMAKVKTVALTAAQKTQAVAAKMLGVSQTQAATATGVLRAKIIALQATLTLGLAVALTVVIDLLLKLFNKSTDAAEGIEQVNKAEDAYRQARAAARAETAADIVALEELIKNKGKESEKVSELNRKYGDAFGTYDSAASWYDVLTTKSKEYCQQLAYEAMAVEYKEELAEALKKLDETTSARDNTHMFEQRIVVDREADLGTGDKGAYHFEDTDKVSDAWTKAAEAVDEAQAAVDSISDSMAEAMKKAGELADSLRQTGEQDSPVNPDTTTNSVVNIDKLEDAISNYKTSVERAVEVHKVFGDGMTDMEVRMNAMRTGITSLIKQFGLENEQVQSLIKNYKRLAESDPLPKLAAITAAATTGHSGISSPVTDMPKVDTGNLETATDAISALGQSMRSLSGAVGEGASAWLSWISNLLSAVAAAIPAIAALTAARTAEANANAAAAATGAGAATASIPVVGPVLAVAAIASVIAALVNLPKFADGGIAYGTTLGIFGEYAGAAHNPEVVAPLDRLKALMGSDGGGFASVDFKIRGRDLMGILQKEQRIKTRVG